MPSFTVCHIAKWRYILLYIFSAISRMGYIFFLVKAISRNGLYFMKS